MTNQTLTAIIAGAGIIFSLLAALFAARRGGEKTARLEAEVEALNTINEIVEKSNEAATEAAERRSGDTVSDELSERTIDPKWYRD